MVWSHRSYVITSSQHWEAELAYFVSVTTLLVEQKHIRNGLASTSLSNSVHSEITSRWQEGIELLPWSVLRQSITAFCTKKMFYSEAVFSCHFNFFCMSVNNSYKHDCLKQWLWKAVFAVLCTKFIFSVNITWPTSHWSILGVGSFAQGHVISDVRVTASFSHADLKPASMLTSSFKLLSFWVLY